MQTEEELWINLYILNGHLDWEVREHYLKLLEEFIDGKISMGKFCSEFCKRCQLIIDMGTMLESNLILLSPHEKSLDFSNFVNEIFTECEL